MSAADVTLRGERVHLALVATYELEAIADLMLEVARRADLDLLRGVGLRMHTLGGVVMSALDDELVQMAELRRAVYGDDAQPAVRARAAGRSAQ